MLVRGAAPVTGARHGGAVQAEGRRWKSPPRATTPSARPPQSASPPPRLPWTSSRGVVAVAVVVVLLVLEAAPCCSLEATCPPEAGSQSYCQCGKDKGRSGFQINIKCDFQKAEDVVLTENLYPFRESGAMMASVNIINATSVRVTQGFLKAWLGIFSVRLDLWHCGTVNLISAPLVDLSAPPIVTTFIGIGLVDCLVPELPAALLRDRVSASLLVKNSVLGTVRRGVFQRVRKVRYIVIMDSVVEVVEGSVAAEGYFRLNQLDGHRWNGLELSNVTIREVGPGAFSLRHKAKALENTHKVIVQNSRLEHMGRGAITAQGDVAVTIIDNSFSRLEDEAIKVDVTRDLKFEGNLVAAGSEYALRGIKCHDYTELGTNTIHLTTERNVSELLQPAFSPFPASCSHSQVIRVVNSSQFVTRTAVSHVTWVLLGLLVVLLLALVVVLHWWRENNKLQNFSANHFQSSNGVPSSARYQANQQEVNMVQDGVANPLYDRTAL